MSQTVPSSCVDCVCCENLKKEILNQIEAFRILSSVHPLDWSLLVDNLEKLAKGNVVYEEPQPKLECQITTPVTTPKSDTSSNVGRERRKDQKKIVAATTTDIISDTSRRSRTKWKGTWADKCRKILDDLRYSSDSVFFRHPVRVPNYAETIEKPMCLDMIDENLYGGRYSTLTEFHDDMMLIFRNCYDFNTDHSPKNKLQIQVRDTCAKLLASYKSHLKKFELYDLVKEETVSVPIVVKINTPEKKSTQGSRRGGGRPPGLVQQSQPYQERISKISSTFERKDVYSTTFSNEGSHSPESNNSCSDVREEVVCVPMEVKTSEKKWGGIKSMESTRRGRGRPPRSVHRFHPYEERISKMSSTTNVTFPSHSSESNNNSSERDAKALLREKLKTVKDYLATVETPTGKLYKCTICDREMTLRANALLHIRRDHFLERISCSYCPRKFYNTVILKSHLQKCKGRHNKNKNNNDSEVTEVCNTDAEPEMNGRMNKLRFRFPFIHKRDEKEEIEEEEENNSQQQLQQDESQEEEEPAESERKDLNKIIVRNSPPNFDIKRAMGVKVIVDRISLSALSTSGSSDSSRIEEDFSVPSKSLVSFNQSVPVNDDESSHGSPVTKQKRKRLNFPRIKEKDRQQLPVKQRKKKRIQAQKEFSPIEEESSPVINPQQNDSPVAVLQDNLSVESKEDDGGARNSLTNDENLITPCVVDLTVENSEERENLSMENSEEGKNQSENSEARENLSMENSDEGKNQSENSEARENLSMENSDEGKNQSENSEARENLSMENSEERENLSIELDPNESMMTEGTEKTFLHEESSGDEDEMDLPSEKEESTISAKDINGLMQTFIQIQSNDKEEGLSKQITVYQCQKCRRVFDFKEDCIGHISSTHFSPEKVKSCPEVSYNPTALHQTKCNILETVKKSASSPKSAKNNSNSKQPSVYLQFQA